MKLSVPKRVIFGAILAGGFVAALLISEYYREQVTWVTEEQGRALTAIADMKTGTLSAWRRERLGDASGVPASSAFGRFVRDYLSTRAASAEHEIRNYFELLKSNHDYTAILLFDAGGKLRLSSDRLSATAERDAAAVAVEAVARNRPIFEDFHADDDEAPHLAVAGPVRDQDGQTIAAIVFRINPGRFLYPQLQKWPMTSQSAETLLIRRDGDNVTYLTELRHRPKVSLRFRLPIDTQDLPAARAAIGQEGPMAGIDYRGVPVLASVRRVPDSPWFLVAKVDRSEAFAPLRSRTRYFGLTVVLLMGLSGCGLFLIWSRRESHHYRQLYTSEAERTALARRYEYLQRYANDSIILVNEKGQIVEGNERAIATYGYSREEFLSMNIRQVRAPSALAELDRLWEAAAKGGTVFETLHRRADGSIFPVEVSSGMVQIGAQRFRQSFVRDISERKRAEEALRNSQADLNRAQAVAHVGSWRLSTASGELLWSDETYRIFGIREGTRLSYDAFLACVHPDDREMVEGSWMAAMRGQEYDCEHRIVVGDQLKWVRERAELDFDAAGALLGGFGTVQDITEQRNWEQALLDSEQRFRQLVENIDSVFWIADVQTNRMLYVSPAIERMWGVLLENVQDNTRNWILLVHPEDRAAANQHSDKSRNSPSALEYRIVLPTGETRWVRDRRFPIAGDEGITHRIAGITEDITSRKLTEQAMQRMNESLQEFAFVASHDLQEPIRVVQCFTQLLERRYKGRLDAQADQFIDTILQGSRRMSQLVEGLLAYSRLTQQEHLESPVDMEEALATALANLRTALDESGAAVTHDPLPSIPWDKAPAVHVFQNLIGNAIKYRKPNEPIRIHVGGEYSNGAWHCTVSDNGIGMDPALVGRIFGLFKRLHGREYPGNGIGLAICRKLVERQGGRIWAESELGKGATFHFALPMQFSHGAPDRAIPAGGVLKQ